MQSTVGGALSRVPDDIPGVSVTTLMKRGGIAMLIVIVAGAAREGRVIS